MAFQMLGLWTTVARKLLVVTVVMTPLLFLAYYEAVLSQWYGRGWGWDKMLEQLGQRKWVKDIRKEIQQQICYGIHSRNAVQKLACLLHKCVFYTHVSKPVVPVTIISDWGGVWWSLRDPCCLTGPETQQIAVPKLVFCAQKRPPVHSEPLIGVCHVASGLPTRSNWQLCYLLRCQLTFNGSSSRWTWPVWSDIVAVKHLRNTVLYCTCLQYTGNKDLSLGQLSILLSTDLSKEWASGEKKSIHNHC